MSETPWTVIDLFSGAGGMSYGFHAHPDFRIVGAVDAQVGKPSSGTGSLDCNRTYEANIGIKPLDLDLSLVSAGVLREALQGTVDRRGPTVLISCAPCTGFSRTLSTNHLSDDPRNSLVSKSAEFVKAFRPRIFLMENARELIQGRNSHHFDCLDADLRRLGYSVKGNIHFLNRFGLPQRRERAIVIAVSEDLPLRGLEELWDGHRLKVKATHVRQSIASLPPLEAGQRHPSDPLHVSPKMAPLGLKRLRAIPKDGGSWIDLRGRPDSDGLLTPAMKNYIAKGDFGSHPDVYGRLWWDRPAVTIKRECGHTGNGRYAHPEQDRLCTIREMAILQGFPRDYRFVSSSVANCYRHIGDAVPPLISYQLARLCEWVLTGRKPELEELILAKTPLTVNAIEKVGIVRRSESESERAMTRAACTAGRAVPKS